MKLRIREIRISQGLTQDHVANLMGVSKPHLSEMERGIKNINFHQLAKLRVIYNVPVWDLFTYKPGSDEHLLIDAISQLRLLNVAAVKVRAADLLESQE